MRILADNPQIYDKPTTVDGVRAVELRYRAIRQTDTDNLAFYQSSMRLNSPSMGTLMPDRYLPVLDRTDQCVSVFKLALIQLLQASAKFTERGIDFDWSSIYMPLRLLKKSDCVKTVSEISEKYKISPDKICFELSSSLLDEKDTDCAAAIKKLRSMGYRFMLAGAGGDRFPLMKLANHELDYIMLDREVTDMLDVSERSDLCVKSMISFINELGAEPVATGVSTAAQAFKLYNFECSFYTGEYAGNFMLERFVRKKQED